MHIKLVVNSFPAASETFLFNLVTGLEKRGIKVTVCANRKSDDLHLYAHRLHEWSGSIQYISKKHTRLKHVLKQLSLIQSDPALFTQLLKNKGVRQGWSYFAILQGLVKDNPDIIHFSLSSIAVRYLDYMSDLSERSIKVIVSCRGTAENVKPLFMPELNDQLKAVLFSAHLVHCVSISMKEKLIPLGLKEEKAFVNYPSIEPNKFARNGRMPLQTRASLSIISVGRLTFQKGFPYALQALKILADKNISFTYHIIGDGADRGMITYLIEELGLKNSVIMLGKASSDKVLEALEGADVFLLPSLSEGVSNAALEAMAMELPIISTRAGGMTEVIRHGENGLLTDWRNPQHMAEQLVWVMENPCKAIEMGRKARLTVTNMFSLDRQLDVFVEQYERLCGD